MNKINEKEMKENLLESMRLELLSLYRKRFATFVCLFIVTAGLLATLYTEANTVVAGDRYQIALFLIKVISALVSCFAFTYHEHSLRCSIHAMLFNVELVSSHDTTLVKEEQED
jgi:hypothetical protein